jgi:hypothetical protein
MKLPSNIKPWFETLLCYHSSHTQEKTTGYGVNNIDRACKVVKI